MLQLLLERGQSYADLASLLGVDEAEVRARARAALTELAGADPDRRVGLTDYLLGQADPIGRADAVRHLKDDPADLELATEVAQKIRLIAPAAELPRLPGEERRPRPRRARGTASSRLPVPDRLRRRQPADETAESGAGAETEPPARPRSTMSRRQTQLAVGLGTAVVLVAMIVLGVAGAFSSGDGDGEATTTTNAANSGVLARVAMKPQGSAERERDGDHRARPGRFAAVRGPGARRVGGPFAEGGLRGLDSFHGRSGATQSPSSVPCGSTVSQPCLSENGRYRDRLAIEPGVLALVARVRFVEVSIAPVKEITQAVNQAVEDETIIVNRPGTTVLRGVVSAGRDGGGGAGGG